MLLTKFSLFSLLISLAFHLNTVEANKMIVCYHGSWSFYRSSLGKFDIATDLDPFLCTHLVYAFVGIDATGKLQVKDSHLDLSDNKSVGNYQKLNELKTKNPQLKTLLSVGGEKMSENFSKTAADPLKRSTFLKSALEFLHSYGFNGLDIDWEYPNQRHNLKENKDRENFVTLLKELRAGLKPHGYLLTAAVGPAEYKPELSYNIPEMIKYLDFINVMAYDLHGPWENVIGHNAPLYPGPLDTTERAKQHSFDALAKYWIKKGAPHNKLVMGIPFYARSYTLKDAKLNGIGSPRTGPGIGGQYTKQAGILGYYEMCEKFKNEKSVWHTKWDEKQMVPYTFNNLQWISFDDERSVTMKLDYVSKEHFAGIMIWTIELDDFRGVCSGKKYPLLSLINDHFKKH